MRKTTKSPGEKIVKDIKRVWAAFTSPADIAQWNFASDDWCCPSAEADLRVGGT